MAMGRGFPRQYLGEGVRFGLINKGSNNN